MKVTHQQETYFSSQLYGSSEVNGANRSSFLANGTGDDSNAPICLQLCQPQQEDRETTGRATKIR